MQRWFVLTYILTFIFMVKAINFDFDGADNDEWALPASWTSTPACTVGVCYPGADSMRADSALMDENNKLLKLTSGPVEPTPLTVNCNNCGVHLGLPDVSLTVATITNGEITVAEDAAFTQLHAFDTITINTGKTLTVSGSVNLENNDVLANLGTLSASGYEVRFKNDHTLTSGTIGGNIIIQDNTAVTMNGGTILDSIQVNSGSSFTFNGGSIDDAQVTVLGSLTVASDIDSDSTLTADSGSSVSFDSTAGALSVAYNQFDLSVDTLYTCDGNDITLSSVMASNFNMITVTGSSSTCKVTLPVDVTDRALAVSGAILSLVSTGATTTFGASVTISGGTLETNSQLLISKAGLTISGSGKLIDVGGAAVKIQQQTVGNSISITSDQDFTFDYSTADTAKGTFTVNNVDSLITFTGADKIETGNNWNFAACEKVVFNQDLDTNFDFGVGCESEFNQITTIKQNTMTFSAFPMLVPVGATFTQDATSALSLSGTTMNLHGTVSLRALSASNSASLNVNAGVTTLSGSPGIVNTDIILNAGTLNITAVSSLNLQTSSTLHWVGGDLVTDSDTVIAPSGGSEFEISATGKTLNGTVSLNSGTLTLQSSVTFSDASLTATSSTVTINAAQTFESTFTVTLTDSAIAQNIGQLTINSNSWNVDGSGGSWAVDSPLVINGKVSVADDFTVMAPSTLQVSDGAELLVDTGATWHQNGAATLSGQLTVTGSGSSFTTTDTTTFSNSPVVLASSSAIVTFSSPVYIATDSTFIASSMATISIVGGTASVGDFTANGGTIGFTSTDLGIAGTSANVNLDSTGVLSIHNTVKQVNLALSTSTGSQIIINSGARFVWTGDLTVNDFSISGAGELVTEGTGSIEIQNGGSVSMSGTLNDGTGSLVTSGSAVLSIIGGTFTSNKDHVFNDTTQVYLGGSTLTYTSMLFDGNSQLHLDGATITVLDYPVAFSGNSRFYIEDTNTEVTLNEEIVVLGTSWVTTDGATVTINEDGTYAAASVSFSIDCEVYLYGGNTDVIAGTKVTFSNSILEVGAGSMTFYSGTTLEFNSGCTVSQRFITSSGRITMKAGSTLIISNSNGVKSDELPFVIEEGATVTSGGSGSTEYGTTVEDAGPACVFYDDENAQSYSEYSNVTLHDRGCWVFTSSSLTFDESIFNLQDHSRIFFDNSTFHMRGNDAYVDMTTNSTFVMDNGSIVTTFSPFFTNPTIETNDYHIQVSGGSNFQVYDEFTMSGKARTGVTEGSIFLVSGHATFGQGTELVMDSSVFILYKVFDSFCFTIFGFRFCFYFPPTRVDLEGTWIADDCVLAIADQFYVSGNGNAQYTRTNVSSSFRGKVYLSNSGTITATDQCYISVGDYLSLEGQGKLLLDNRSVFAMNTSATISMEEFGLISLSDYSVIYVDGPLFMEGDASVSAVDGSHFVLLGTGDVIMRDRSNFTIEDNYSSLSLYDGQLRLYGSSEILASNTGQVVLTTGSLTLFEFASAQLDSGIFSVASNGFFSGYSTSSFTLLSSSFAQLNGTARLYDDSDLLIEGSSTFSIYGELDVYDGASIVLDNSMFSILEENANNFGQIVLHDNATLSSMAGTLSVSGSLVLLDYSDAISTGGQFYLRNEQLLAANHSQLILGSGSFIEIDGGELNAQGNAFVEVDNSEVSIINQDMNILDSAIFDVIAAGRILISGDGDALFAGESYTTISGTGSSINVQTGASVCRDNATIEFTNTGVYNISSSTGRALFEGNCEVIGTLQGDFYSSGETTFADQASIDLAFADFTVVDGNCTFQNSTTGTLHIAQFIVDGFASFEGYSLINVGQFSNFTVSTGNVYQSENASIVVNSGRLSVASNFFQSGESSIRLAPGTMIVGGSFESRDDTTVTAVGSTIFLNSGATVDLYDRAAWEMNNGGSITVVADFAMHNSSTLTSVGHEGYFEGNVNLDDFSVATANMSSTYIIQQGNFIASSFSSVNIIYDSLLSVTSGNVLFQHESVLFVDGTSQFIVSDGNVVFQDLTNFQTEPNTVISVSAGSLTFQGSVCQLFDQVLMTVGGDLSMRLDSCINFQNSSITVADGNLEAVDNFQLSFTETSIEINLGNALFNGTSISSLAFNSLPIDILSGSATFTGFSVPYFTDTVLTVTNGGARFSENAHSIWTDSAIIIDDVEVGPFVYFEDSSISEFYDSLLQVTGGEVVLSDSSQSTWLRSNVTLDSADLKFLNNGTHHFFDSLISVTGAGADADFGDFVTARLDNTDFLVETEGSVVRFFGNVDVENVDMLFSIFNGDVFLSDLAKLSYLDSSFEIASGSLTSSGNATLSFVNTPFTLLASSTGSMDVSGYSYFTYTNSPIFMNSGDINFSFHSTLEFTDVATTLHINFGSFVFQDFADFFTVQGTRIDITSGTFELLGNVDISFDQVTTSVDSVSGLVLLTDSAKLSSLDSVFDVVGSVEIRMNSNFTTVGSSIDITGGILSTFGQSAFQTYDTTIDVTGNVEFRGNVFSNHYFETSSISIFDGADFLLYEQVTAHFVDSLITLEGGFFQSYASSTTIIESGSMSLEGDGTLLMFNDANLVLTNDAFVGVVTSGATATFSDDSSVNVLSLSTMNITDGSVSFEDRSTFNLWTGTYFNLIDGSLFLRHTSNMIAYPFTQGIIHGGNLHIRDDACLTFIQSDISIVGSIDNNSTCAVNFISGTNITVTGTVEIGGLGVININNGSFLHVLDGSIILYDYASIRSDNASILVSGGSILAYDWSLIWADNSTDVVVDGGNITLSDLSTLHVAGESFVLVTVSDSTQGAVYGQGSSVIYVSEGSHLEVNQGNLIVSEHASMTNEDSLIRVVGGNLIFLDFASLDAFNGDFEVLVNGNLTAAGIGSSLNFCDSRTRIQGDLILAIRNTMLSKNSTFEVTAAGNVFLTDITRTRFEENSQMEIFGGGNLELFRSAYFELDSSSDVLVGNGGSALFGEDVIFDMFSSSTLHVNGGDMVFYSDATLNAKLNSVGEVTGGGSIFFSDQTVATLSEFSRLSVFDDGSIFFSDSSAALLSTESFLFVQDGGSIVFSEAAELSSDHSFLTVLGGGSIVLSGTGISHIVNESQFVVRGGNIIYRDEKIIQFDFSSFEISSGDFQTFDNAIFNMNNQSSGSVSGGDLTLHNASTINMNDESDIRISAGNVQMYNNGNVHMNSASISVTGASGISGNFFLHDNVKLSMFESSVTVSGGDFESQNAVFTSSVSSVISVTSGSATFSGSSEYDGVTSQMLVSGGNLNLIDVTTWTLSSESLASVTGGHLNLLDSSETSLIDSSFDVSGGNINLKAFADLSMLRSALVVTGGDLIHSGSSHFISEQTTIDISSGRIIYDENSLCDMESTTVTVQQSTLSARLPSPIAQDDLMIYGGDSYVHVFGSSVIDLLQGNFVLVERATGLFEDTTITVDGGSLEIKGSAASTFKSSTLSLLQGDLLATDSTSVALDDSSVDISGGSLLVESQSNVVMSVTSISIREGSARFTGGTSSLTASSISVSGEGFLEFSGSSIVRTVGSTLSLSGNGEFLIADAASTTFDSTLLSVQSGTFTTQGNTNILFDNNSLFTIEGGDTFFSGNSVVDISSSTMQVLDGNVYFNDDSRVIVRSDSVYSVEGGNVFTTGSTNLQLSASCFVLAEGSVTYGDSSTIELISSCWNITGGDAIFEDSTAYSLTENSLLFIEEGSFAANGTINLFIDSSRAHVIGGDFELQGQSSLTIRADSTVEVEKGNAIFSGVITTAVSDSSFLVSGGYVLFDGSSTLTWANSELEVSSGDMITQGTALVSFVDSTISVSGGGLRFLDSSAVSVLTSEIHVSMGSLNFLGDSIVDITDSSVRIEHGDMQFGGNSQVRFTRSPTYLAGQLEFIDRAQTVFTDSAIEIIGGSFHAKDHTDVQFLSSSIDISGSLHIQNDADVIVSDSWIVIDQGDLRVFDRGSFSVHNSSFRILNGDFIVMNPTDDARKYVSIQDSIISVESSESSPLQGNVMLSQNVELTMTTTDFIIDGSLILEGDASLNIFEESSFVIPTGAVKMDASSRVIVDGGSVLLNQGQLVAPGQLNAPSDSSLTNEGILESQHDLFVNCDAEDIAPLVNSGTFALSPEALDSPVVQSCIADLRHSGLMQFAHSNVTFNRIETSIQSVFTLTDSSVVVHNDQNTFESNGSVGGSGSFVGSLANTGSGIMMASGENGASRIHVEEEFESSGTMFFVINSRDLNEPDAITQVTAGGVILSGGRACVCFNPSLTLEEGDRFDLVAAQSRLQGTYAQVEFNCVECPRRASKSMASVSEECEPRADYGSSSFAVLFASCGGGSGNYFDTLSPPWYVIFPVALGVLVLVVLIFGGGLVLEQKMRQRTTRRKLARKKEMRKKQFKESFGSTNKTSESFA